MKPTGVITVPDATESLRLLNRQWKPKREMQISKCNAITALDELLTKTEMGDPNAQCIDINALC